MMGDVINKKWYIEAASRINVDESTGVCTYNEKAPKCSKEGDVIKSPDKDGYFRIGVTVDSKFKMLRMHRVVWFKFNGDLPPILDHIDRCRTNNSPLNLRPSDGITNTHNRKSKTSSTSKFKGVSWNKYMGKWKAGVCAHGKSRHLGYFDSEEDAASMVNLAYMEMHQEYSCYNDLNK
jgi:hypothetical protein